MKGGIPSRLPRSLRLFVVIAALVSGCGGGGDMWAGPGVGGTGSFASGPISGFGSVIVNGVRFDDARAQVYDDDGVLRSRDELALGMMVEVRGSTPVQAASSRSSEASEIRYGAELLGAVEATDAAAGTLQVFGVTVRVKSSTVFANAQGLAGVPLGGVVEVHGLHDDSGAVVATRIDLKAPSMAAYTTGGGKVLRLTARVVGASADGLVVQTGAGTLSVNSPGGLPGGVAPGATVKLRLRPPSGAGALSAEGVAVQSAHLPEAGVEAEIEGFITRFESAASFQVAGVTVSTGPATNFIHGSQAVLRQGARVQIDGVMSNGVLAASKVDFKVRDDNDPGNDDTSADSNGGGNGGGSGGGNGGTSGNGNGNGNGGTSGNGSGSSSPDAPFELHGRLGSLDTASQVFRLRGQTVRYTSDTRFEDGTAAELSNGQQVEVRGVLDADGNVLLATLIRIGG